MGLGHQLSGHKFNSNSGPNLSSDFNFVICLVFIHFGHCLHQWPNVFYSHDLTGNRSKYQHQTSELCKTKAVGFLGIRFEGGNYHHPCLKVVRIMLETSDLARKYTYWCSFRKYTLQYHSPLSFAHVSIIFAKIPSFFDKNSTFAQSNSVRGVLENPQFCFNSLLVKGLLLMKT